MKIAIEAQRIFRKEKHGMDFVALELIKALQQMDYQNQYTVLVAPGTDKCLSSTSNFEILEIGTSNYLLWEQFFLPRALKKLQPDIVHCTSNTAPLFCPSKLILTLHDIIFLEKKMGNNSSIYQNLGRIYRRLVVPEVLKKVQKVITVSDFEKTQILAGVNLREDQVHSIYNGVGEQFRVMTESELASSKYIKESQFWFLLGNTDPKKNLSKVLLAYSFYAKQSKFPKPILVADLDGDYLDQLLADLGISGIRNLIHTTGYIPNKELPSIYNSSFAFLYPSLRESFGLPVIEAMACGKPVITSNTFALPEIAGSGALLVDPDKESEIAGAMLRLEDDTQLFQQQVKYGLLRAKEFSWENTARKTLELYNQI